MTGSPNLGPFEVSERASLRLREFIDQHTSTWIAEHGGPGGIALELRRTRNTGATGILTPAELDEAQRVGAQRAASELRDMFVRGYTEYGAAQGYLSSDAYRLLRLNEAAYYSDIEWAAFETGVMLGNEDRVLPIDPGPGDPLIDPPIGGGGTRILGPLQPGGATGDVLSLFGAALAGYHGYARNRGRSAIPWALAWGAAGYLLPVVFVPAAFVQGYARPAGAGASRRRRTAR